jgi:hypothetical protein
MSDEPIEVRVIVTRHRPPSKKEVTMEEILAGQLTNEEVEAVLRQIQRTLKEYQKARKQKKKP